MEMKGLTNKFNFTDLPTTLRVLRRVLYFYFLLNMNFLEAELKKYTAQKYILEDECALLEDLLIRKHYHHLSESCSMPGRRKRRLWYKQFCWYPFDCWYDYCVVTVMRLAWKTIAVVCRVEGLGRDLAINLISRKTIQSDLRRYQTKVWKTVR